MEYLQQSEVTALLTTAHSYGNKEAHLALVLMYATGTRVSQALALKGVDIDIELGPQEGAEVILRDTEDATAALIEKALGNGARTPLAAA